MDFNWLPAGEFRMGARGMGADEEPPHLVRLSGFYMGIFPVTQEQFAVWTQAKQIDHKNGFPGQPQHPAETLDWHQATQFCEWLNSTHDGDLPTGFCAALPSEAQWEYACRLMKDRSGNPQAVETEYYTGDGEAALVEAGWYTENARSSTQPVGQKKATDFGLYDLHGNVWEWCRDGYDADAYKRRVDGVVDPVVAAGNDGRRVMRGGGWNGSPAGCRSAYRSGGAPGDRSGYQGFRVCLLPVPGSCPAAAGSETVAESEPGTGDVAWRDDIAKSQVRGGDGAAVDLSRSNLPSRSDEP